MSYIHPAAIAYQRRRWERADAYRFAAPGTPEAKMPGYRHPWAAVARAEEAKAAAEQAERAEQEALRADLEQLHRLVKDLRIDLALRRLCHKYSPDQPRVPAGNPDGGQWTSGGGSGAGRDTGRDASRLRSTDFSAQARRGGGGSAQVRIGNRTFDLSPAQATRLDLARDRADWAIARVRDLDPNWRPTPSAYESVEGLIRAHQAEFRQADARFLALSRADNDAPYQMPNPPRMAEIVAPGGQLAGSHDRRAGEDVRMVTPAEFEAMRIKLMAGARRVDADAIYDGVLYRREDGSEFGLRLSREHGLTLEVTGSDHPLVRQGLRFHQR